MLYNYFISTFKLPMYFDLDSMQGHVNSDDNLFQVKCVCLRYMTVCEKKV